MPGAGRTIIRVGIFLDVMRACYALRPESINWPENDDGLPSFRLERLTKAGGIEHANAHDAMRRKRTNKRPVDKGAGLRDALAEALESEGLYRRSQCLENARKPEPAAECFGDVCQPASDTQKRMGIHLTVDLQKIVMLITVELLLAGNLRHSLLTLGALDIRPLPGLETGISLRGNNQEHNGYLFYFTHSLCWY